MNGRLGIEGGISILGTTGIVVPFSCASWIHSIHRGIDVARELGLDYLLAATGRTSERAANDELKLSDQALIDMGDFCGGMLKYLRAHPVQHVTIAGGFAKMTKLAQGATDLHSSRSSVDVAALAELLNELKAAPEQVARAHDAISAAQVLEIAGPLAPTLAATIARRAREVALATLAGGTEIEVRIYNREAKLLASSVDKAEGGS